MDRSLLIIVRHAQSAANAGERSADPTTIPITGLGARQAHYVAGLMSERPAIVVVSRFLRTLQTADPLLTKYPGVPREEWPIEEFTYLDLAACARTTYAERSALREAYWQRCDPLWTGGPGCECFTDFIARVRRFEERLSLRGANETVIVFTHGLVIRALLWRQQHTAGTITSGAMAGFDSFQRRVSVPNCAVLRAVSNGSGLLLSPTLAIDHIPADLRTE